RRPGEARRARDERGAGGDPRAGGGDVAIVRPRRGHRRGKVASVVATELPAIVIEAEAPRTPRTIASLGTALDGLHVFEAHDAVHAIDATPAPPIPTLAFDDKEHAARVASIEASLHAARATLDLADAT